MPVYFTQTPQWSNFWLQSKPNNHKLHFFEHENLSVFVCEYPWFLGQKFWYIPRGFVSNSENSSENAAKFTQILLKKIILQAKTEAICFIKLDFETEFLGQLNLSNLSSVQVYLEEFLNKEKLEAKAKISSKKLQYLHTLKLDLSELANETSILTNTAYKHPPSATPPPPSYVFVPNTPKGGLGEFDQELNLEILEAFWQQNQPVFEKLLDKDTRYGTRKSFQFGWRIDTQKSEENLEAFWQLHLETAQKHSFGTHPKVHMQELLKQDFSRLIILKDQEQKAHGAWFGINLNEGFVHLYGGNDLISRQHFGQYLMHLAAFYTAVKEGANSYDFGGLEEGTGYSHFKKGYKGQIVEFIGPIDIILSSLQYKLTNLAIQIRKSF